MDDECEKCGLPHDPRRCKAHRNTDGLQCTRWPVEGMLVCPIHGGSTPAARRTREERKALRVSQAALETFGKPVETDPREALLQELYRTAGAVEWLGAIVGDLDRGEVTWGLTEETLVGSGPPQLQGSDAKYTAGTNAWVTLWQQERKHLVAVSKECLNAGIEERKVRLAEQAGDSLVTVIRAILDALGLSPEQRVVAGEVVPAQLRILAAKSASEAMSAA